jgi:hypothetical protein
MIPRFDNPLGINVVVVGRETNAYRFATDFRYLKSEFIDK